MTVLRTILIERGEQTRLVDYADETYPDVREALAARTKTKGWMSASDLGAQRKTEFRIYEVERDGRYQLVKDADRKVGS